MNQPLRTSFILRATICLVLSSQAALASPVELGARGRLAGLSERTDKATNHGQAASLAIRAAWLEQWREDFSSLIEADAIASGWHNKHSDGVRFNGEPRIPDVPGADFNQVYLQLGTASRHFRIGRQTLEWDDLRFLSANSFWQNPQSFEALYLKQALGEASHIQYAFINKAVRIFGRDADKYLTAQDINYQSQNGLRPKDGLGEHEMNTHALHWLWREWDYTEFAAYGYFIDNTSAPNLSNDTLGLRIGYQRKFSTWNYRLLLAGGRQRRNQLSNSFDLPYWHIQNTLGSGSQEWSLDYELLGAKNKTAFITPLGFTHEYQGWADRFTTTPTAGLEDISLRNTSRWGRLRLDTRFHFFYSIEDRAAFGEELDAELGYQFSAKQKIALRAAKFTAATAYKNSLKSALNVYLTAAYQY